jgi:hypothetical protein
LQEYIMKATSLFLATLTLAVGSAFAEPPIDNTRPLTRAEVKASVLAARAAGELKHAGPEYDGPSVHRNEKPSNLTRAEVRSDVIVARALGELTPAGEGGAYAAPVTPATTLARAQVKQETLQARAEGTLIPAGEGIAGVEGVIRPTSTHTALVKKLPAISSVFHLSSDKSQ